MRKGLKVFPSTAEVINTMNKQVIFIYFKYISHDHVNDGAGETQATR